MAVLQASAPRQSQSLRERAAWLLRFAELDLSRGDRDNPRLRQDAWRAVDPTCARPMQWDELVDVHRRFRAGLAELRAGRPWRLEVPGEHVVLPGRGGGIEGRFAAQWPWDRFLIAAMDMLVSVGDRLRTCGRPGCRRALIAAKRQKYCAECAAAIQKERVQDWRRRHAQRVRDLAHEAYVQRKRRETGRPRLKIERRPRVGREKAAR